MFVFSEQTQGPMSQHVLMILRIISKHSKDYVYKKTILSDMCLDDSTLYHNFYHVKAPKGNQICISQ